MQLLVSSRLTECTKLIWPTCNCMSVNMFPSLLRGSAGDVLLSQTGFRARTAFNSRRGCFLHRGRGWSVWMNLVNFLGWDFKLHPANIMLFQCHQYVCFQLNATKIYITSRFRPKSERGSRGGRGVRGWRRIFFYSFVAFFQIKD